MDVKWIIVWLSIQITAMSMYITKQAYNLGYERGKIEVLTTWQGDPDSSCFAKGGNCDTDTKATKCHK